jgi:hypothetical protein
MLEDAYDPRVAMILVITFPVFVVRRALGLIPSQNLVEGLDADLKVSLHKLAFSHALVIGAANPAFFILFIIEIMVVSAIKAVWAIFSESGGGNSVVEMSYAAARIGALSRHLHA